MKTMKSNQLVVSLLALFVLVNSQLTLAGDDPNKAKKAAPKATELKVDASKSTVNWKGKKVTGEHVGTVKVSKGVLSVEGNKLVGGSFDMDMKSIVNTDLTDASYNAKLIGHLKSDDFFSVEKNPVSTLKITKVEPIAGAKAGEPNYNITGDLTIKGITNPITFPATVKITGKQADATAQFAVDRTKYDIKYGSKNFFEGLGDKAIYDEFQVELSLVAGK
jgi:polyisoprenoid-binding protein YceI